LDPSLFHLASLRLEECTIELLLICREFRRDIDLDMDNQISCCSSLAVKSLHTLTTECDQCSMLCSSLDLDISLTEYREIQRSVDTECCLSWRDMHTIVEIRSITSESTLTTRNCECDIEITIAISSLVPFTSDLDRHTIFYTFRDIDSLSGFFFELSLAMTIATLLDHSLSCAVA
jgi:hypothetical protein